MFYDFAKRAIDIVGSLIAIIIFSPIMIFVIVLIKLTSPGPALYTPVRVGKNGKLFKMFKFRSMHMYRIKGKLVHAEKYLESHPKLMRQYQRNSYKLKRDPRITPIGKILRKFSLDELPQLINVIRGDMSLVGPRPERPEFAAELEREVPFYRMRELVLPGITGWAQINMENDASVSDAPEKLQYDLYYIKNRSLFLDIAILLKTALHLLQRSGR